MSKRKVVNWTVEDLDRERPNISFPEYQRERSLWTPEKKALLIDSIFRDVDIPKLYFNRVQKDAIEVIDGQQRLWSVWEYLDDEYPCKVGNQDLRYSELSPSQKSKIKKYEFQVTEFAGAGEDYLRLLFLRLQWGLLLNTGEKLHAATGKMKDFIFDKFVKHPFVTALGIPTRRYAPQTLCAQICINLTSQLKQKSFTRTRYEDLLHFFSEYQNPLGISTAVFNESKSRAILTSDQLAKIFGNDAKKLRNRSYILSVFLLHNHLAGTGEGLAEKDKSKFRDFVLLLIQRLREESKLGIDRTNRELYSFETMLSSAPGERYQIQRRHEKLTAYFESFKRSGKIPGD